MEHVAQAKQGHVEYLGVFVWQNLCHIPMFSEDFAINVSAMWDDSKVSFKTTVALPLGKK